MNGIPSDKGYCIDCSLCAYTGYFPKLPCILRMCKDCGTEKFKKYILQRNKSKCCDKRKRFLEKSGTQKLLEKKVLFSLLWTGNLKDAIMNS